MRERLPPGARRASGHQSASRHAGAPPFRWARAVPANLGTVPPLILGAAKGRMRSLEVSATMVIDLEGKVGVVTGAAAGIGRGLATAFAREGVKTVALDVGESQLTDLEREFTANGWDGLFMKCDVRKADSIEAVIETVLDRHGRIDILVNNAGVAPGGSVESMTEEVWDANLDINTKGTFLMSRAVVPIMKRQRSGRIINAASFAAIVPTCNTAAYAASKGAVVSFTRVLAGELGPWNITVNCYAPGMVPTGLNNFDTRPDEEQKRLLDLLTIRRWQTAEDVSNLVCFLASDLAGYITGTLVDVSGGKLATQLPQAAYEAHAAETG